MWGWGGAYRWSGFLYSNQITPKFRCYVFLSLCHTHTHFHIDGEFWRLIWPLSKRCLGLLEVTSEVTPLTEVYHWHNNLTRCGVFYASLEAGWQGLPLPCHLLQRSSWSLQQCWDQKLEKEKSSQGNLFNVWETKRSMSLFNRIRRKSVFVRMSLTSDYQYVWPGILSIICSV